MTSMKRGFAPAVLLLCALPAAAAQAPDPAPAADERILYTIVPGSSRATFYAHATGHDFSGTTTDVRGHVGFGSQGPTAELGGEVRVGAADLDTGNGKRNEEMRRLLETDQHADIILVLGKLTPEAAAPADKGAAASGGLPAAAKLEGELEVRGVRKPLSLSVSVDATQDAFVARGEFLVDVRDFGIEPPRAMLFIRMDPSVRVEFEARFQRVP